MGREPEGSTRNLPNARANGTPLPHRPNDSGPRPRAGTLQIESAPVPHTQRATTRLHGPRTASTQTGWLGAQDTEHSTGPHYITRSSSLEYSPAIQNSKFHVPVDGSLQQLCSDPLLARVDPFLGSTARTQGLLRQISQSTRTIFKIYSPDLSLAAFIPFASFPTNFALILCWHKTNLLSALLPEPKGSLVFSPSHLPSARNGHSTANTISSFNRSDAQVGHT